MYVFGSWRELEVRGQTWIVSTSPAFMKSSASHPTNAQNGKVDLLAGGGRQRHNLHNSFSKNAVPALPLVGCVVWNQAICHLIRKILIMQKCCLPFSYCTNKHIIMD